MIGEDVASVFEFLGLILVATVSGLLVSPHSSRSGLVARIDENMPNRGIAP